MTLMTIMAHCDDAEIWAGGMIAAQTSAGLPAHIVTMTGEADDERGGEARQAARELGSSITFIGGRDRELTMTDALVNSVTEHLVRVRPRCIVTHWLHDTHPDHVATAQIVHRAILTAAIENNVDIVLSCDTYLGWGVHGPFIPSLYIDVSATWQRKIDAIRCHSSQSPEQYIALAEHQCWLHGARSQTRYAEGFQVVPFFGRALHATSWPPSDWRHTRS